MNGPFTGRHMAAILVAFFGVIVLVNLIMARFATSTFGGVVVENSYVASQEFNRWLDQAEVSRALGWEAHIERDAQGRITAQLTGAPADVALTGIARHPLGHEPDAALNFAPIGENRFVSRQALAPGRWIVRLEAVEGANVWRDELRLP